MCVIELDGGLVWQLLPIRIVAPKTAYQVAHGTRDQEIFLQKSQPLSGSGGVIGIQHSGQRFRFQSLAQRAHEIARAKLLKIEGIRSSRGPKTQGVDGLPSIAHDRTIIRYSEQG